MCVCLCVCVSTCVYPFTLPEEEDKNKRRRRKEKRLLVCPSGYFWLLPFLWLDYGETETWPSIVLTSLSLYLARFRSLTPLRLFLCCPSACLSVCLSLSLSLSLPVLVCLLHLLLQMEASFEMQERSQTEKWARGLKEPHGGRREMGRPEKCIWVTNIIS